MPNREPAYFHVLDKECSEHKEAVEEGFEIRYWTRAGDQVCPECGKRYSRHPLDTDYLAYDDSPFLVIACDGLRLKL